MKSPRFVPFTLPALVATLAAALLTAHTALAGNVEKAANTTALNLAGSYTAGGPPGAGDVILVNSVMGASKSVSLGGNLSISGISFDTTAVGALSIGSTGGFTLTLGSAGIVMTTPSTVSLSSSSNLALSADQTWALGTRSVTISGAATLTENSHLLTITGTNQFSFNSTAAQTLGAQIDISTLTVAGATTGLTLTNTNNSFGAMAISNGGTVIGSTLSKSSGNSTLGKGAITVGGNASNGTLKYAGLTDSYTQTVQHDARAAVSTLEVTTSGQTLTLSSNLTTTNIANSVVGNGWALGGAGNLTLGGIVSDSANATKTGTTLTKFGAGTLTLNAVNTYTGATTINAGTLALGASGSINANSAIKVADGATFDTSARASYTFSTATTTTIGVGTTSSGLIKAAAATFSSADLSLDFGSASSLLASYAVLNVTGTKTGHFDTVTATGTTISGSFTHDGSGGWTLLNVGGYNLTFSESLGTLTAVSAIPEPSTYAVIVGALALSGASLRRRRVKQAV